MTDFKLNRNLTPLFNKLDKEANKDLTQLINTAAIKTM